MLHLRRPTLSPRRVWWSRWAGATGTGTIAGTAGTVTIGVTITTTTPTGTGRGITIATIDITVITTTAGDDEQVPEPRGSGTICSSAKCAPLVAVYGLSGTGGM
ncbi:MAG TPA: hypothetical protein VFY92_11305 [Hyphomicrobiaceae bacterium]|nr:hypothetical protein [Hyphomicrobiaceae bacterium]